MKIVFAGTPEFSVLPLKSLIESKHEVVAVYTQPDRPAGRGRKLKYSPVKECALAADIPVYQPSSLKESPAIEQLRELNADLMVVVAYGLLLPKDVLELPKFGCINIHASLLPRWRGAAPIQRAILAGDVESGVTIMQMDEGLDTGDSLVKVATQLNVDETGESLHDRLSVMGAEAMLEAISAIVNQTLQPISQNNENATYASKLDKVEAKIDWSLSAIEIERLVRAFNPWPVAHTSLKGKPLRIWQTKSIANNDVSADLVYGTVIVNDKDKLDVVTGNGLLRILELQPAGKRKMSSTDFLNARVELRNGNVTFE